MCFSNVEHGSVTHNSPVEVVLRTTDARLVGEAEWVQRQFETPRGTPTLLLHFGEHCIDLRDAETPSKKGYFVDFSTIDRRTGAGNLSKKQPLPKAIGVQNTTVVDATAGFCGDAVMLALMGYNVTALERSPIVAAMVRDGVFRASQIPELWEAVGQRLVVAEEDAFQTLTKYQGVDVVYMDPMFPPKRKKSALPPKHIQLLQSVIACESEARTRELFELARSVATKRVVVKRPHYAPHMRDDFAALHKGKLVRYEVYLGNQTE